jgi:hypothetical protein
MLDESWPLGICPSAGGNLKLETWNPDFAGTPFGRLEFNELVIGYEMIGHWWSFIAGVWIKLKTVTATENLSLDA